VTEADDATRPRRMVLAPPPPHPDEVTLLDYFAAAVLIARLGATTHDIFDTAAAMVAESHRRKGLVAR